MRAEKPAKAVVGILAPGIEHAPRSTIPCRAFAAPVGEVAYQAAPPSICAAPRAFDHDVARAIVHHPDCCNACRLASAKGRPPGATSNTVEASGQPSPLPPRPGQ